MSENAHSSSKRGVYLYFSATTWPMLKWLNGVTVTWQGIWDQEFTHGWSCHFGTMPCSMFLTVNSLLRIRVSFVLPSTINTVGIQVADIKHIAVKENCTPDLWNVCHSVLPNVIPLNCPFSSSFSYIIFSFMLHAACVVLVHACIPPWWTSTLAFLYNWADSYVTKDITTLQCLDGVHHYFLIIYTPGIYPTDQTYNWSMISKKNVITCITYEENLR